MAVYSLTEEIIFPNPKFADRDGLLAVGGDLSEKRLLLAYGSGIFPWYSDAHPILWWSPDPRMVLFPNKFKKHKSLRRTFESGKFNVKVDQNFEQVIDACSNTVRKGETDTWITDEMKDAYCSLHHSGYCHSVETFYKGKLVGGLYGISLGGIFFGESMFHTMTDASKVALWNLVDIANDFGLDLIDVQQETPHLETLGAEPISRQKFLTLLGQSIKKKTFKGNWGELD